MARNKTCRKYRCDAPPEMVGLCAKHYEEDERRFRRREDALAVLHNGVIDGEDIGEGPLRDELKQSA